MRLSTPSALDHALASWAERLRQRLDLPLLVRWQGGSLRLGQFEQALVTVDVRDAAGATALLAPSLDNLGRAYVEGHIDVDGRVQDVIEVAHRLAEASARQDGRAGWVQRAALRMASAMGHSRAQDRAAIRHHYDVSNDFYAEWLDAAMVYSCAYFETGQESLAEAQQRKIDHILTKLRLAPGQTLLDIAAAGARWCCGRRSASARAAWASRCRSNSMPWRASACGPPACAIASTSACRTTATCAARSTASPASAWSSTWG